MLFVVVCVLLVFAVYVFVFVRLHMHTFVVALVVFLPQSERYSFDDQDLWREFIVCLKVLCFFVIRVLFQFQRESTDAAIYIFFSI